jgi:hypothetical protein
VPAFQEGESTVLLQQLLDTCNESRADVNQIVEALMNAMLLAVITVSPDADAAERNIINIANDMRAQIRQKFAEFQMAEARGIPLQ